MNKKDQLTEAPKMSVSEFDLNFELDSTLMETSGELDTLSVVKTAITKITRKSSCTCNCTIFCF